MENQQIVKEYLSKLHIKFKVYKHPAVYTCEEADKLCNNIPGIHSKNLLLKSKKADNFYLVIIEQSKRLDIKVIEKKLGEKITFASDENLNNILGIETGAVSPFALINDKQAKVYLLLDKEINESNIVSFHPNINTETLELTTDDFKKYLKSLKNNIILI